MSTFTRQSVSKFVHILRNAVRMSSSDTSMAGANPAILNMTSVNMSMDASTPREVKSHFAEVNGARLHYEQGGSGKHVVFMLPGAAGSTRTDFGPQLDNFNKDLFTVVSWDPRGYGKSIPPNRDWPEHFFERDALDAVKLMESIGHKKYSLLGWSDGGITALIMAARFPENVRKLVVWGSNSFVTKEEIGSYEKIRDVDNWSKKMREPFVKLYGEEYFRKMWGEWVDAFTVYYKKGGDICGKELDNIKCPTLLVHGVKDALVPGFHPEHLEKRIVNSRLHLMPEGKHNLHLRFYQEFNSLVEAFLIEQE